MPELAFLIPGDPATLTGGYGYDRRIADGLRRLGWDVQVHTLEESFPTPSRAALARTQRLLRALPDGALVLIDGLALGGMPEVVAGERGRLRLAGLVHHPLADETGLDALQAEALRVAELRALAAVDHVVVTSRATARSLAAYGVSAQRVSVVTPGTDPAPLSRGAGSKVLELLCVATLIARKGHTVLFDALAELSDFPWHLSCVGSETRSGGTAARLHEQLLAAGLAERVTFAGEVDGATLDEHYHRADLFVLATYHEGYGMALAEALARGLPIVSSKAGAVPDTVPGDAGLLVAPGDAAAFAAALRRVFSEPGLLGRLASGARRARALLSTWDIASATMARTLDRLSHYDARLERFQR